MIEIAVWLAALCGIVSALTGNRSAWALLASFSLCYGLALAGMDFDFAFWLLVDLLVILAIVRPGMTQADCIIVALFLPAWGFYLAPDPQRYYVATGVVILQLALTAPIGRAILLVKQARNRRKDSGGADMMVMHA